ncbi:FkbM family methyltransferase [Paraburkholderia caballeronis]|uniref:FkbM family methyltransferase n=1 Tax=Paraburkholderia caballeronis TaxID=416943 RepID=UPI0010667AF6|nr:FkbM family methyltransferase [Paraburkholderia caballeronis]
MKLPYTIVLPTVYGQMLVNRHDINQSNALIKTGAAYDVRQIEIASFLCERAPSGSVMLDIGANFGAYSLSCARALMPNGGSVHAFEGQRMLAYMICGSAAINSIENLYVHHACVGNGVEDIPIPHFDYHSEMNFGSVEFGAHQTERLHQPRLPSTENVPQIRIDDMDYRQICFAKIDVEGMEYDVLVGASKTFERERPVALIEYIKSDKAQLANFFLQLDYKVWTWGSDLFCVPREKEASLGIELPAIEGQ